MPTQFKLVWISLLAILCCSCANQQQFSHSKLSEAKPRSILIVPVVNNSVDVYAPTSMLTTLPSILAEKGYYVFPVNTVKMILDHEGLYEPAEVHALPPQELAKMFGADCILYVTINQWASQYVLISTTTVVNFSYKIVSKDGEELWAANKQLTHTPQNDSSGNIFADLIIAAGSAAFERALPNYLPLAHQANQQVFSTGTTAIPPGPYATPK
jgi:Uncharacterized protein conserved in bacteria